MPLHPKQAAEDGAAAGPRTDEAPGTAEEPRGAPEGTVTYAMALAYDGSPFQGWQVQPHGPTVQGKLEQALRTVTGHPVKLYGSGRTDTGVHALNQIASFHAAPGLRLDKLRQSLNGLAAPSIAVKRIVAAGEGFHARHSAIGKTYRYQLFNRPYPPVFAKHRCWWIRSTLDVRAMEQAARALVGTHDFSAFRAAECAAASPVREVRRLELHTAARSDCTLAIEIEASGFLQHMARIITGTLTAVGLGKLPPAEVAAILASGRRENADMTAPGRGLHLVRVAYDLEAFPALAELEPGGDA